MGEWFKVTLTSQEVSDGKHNTLNSAFRDIFLQTVVPAGAAMFQKAGSFGCEYLFSPVAASIGVPLIAAYRGQPCDAQDGQR